MTPKPGANPPAHAPLRPGKPASHTASVGMVMVLTANLGFTMTDSASKWLVLAGFAALQLAFMRYFTHFLITLVQEGWRHKFRRNPFACDRPWLVALRGAMLAFSTMLNFIALKYLPLTITSTIMFSAPLIVALLSWPLLGERVGRARWLAIVLGFGGVLLAVRPFGEAMHWSVFLTLAAATLLALYSITTRELSQRVSTSTMQFYLGAVGVVMYAPFILSTWQSPASALHWALLFSLGLFAWGGHQLLTFAHKLAPANLLMPFSYSYIIFMTIASILLFDQAPDLFTLLGAGIVIIASLIIWRTATGTPPQRQTPNAS